MAASSLFSYTVIIVLQWSALIIVYKYCVFIRETVKLSLSVIGNFALSVVVGVWAGARPSLTRAF